MPHEQPRWGNDLQSLDVGGSRPLYVRVAETSRHRVVRHAASVGSWSARRSTDELAERCARAVGDLPLLVPGVGAQGGDAATVPEHGAAGATGQGRGLIDQLITGDHVRRRNGDDFAKAARAEAIRTAQSLPC